MKSKFLFLATIITINFANAQSYFGYLYDNYSGVHAVMYNPANLVDSRYRTDINLLSFSALGNNDYYSVKLSDMFKNDFDFENQATRHASSSNNFITNVDILGPSFMFNINSKNTIALFSRGRSIVHISNVDGRLLSEIMDDNSNSSFSVNNQNFNIVANGWAEFGLSYARVLADKGKHFFKGGLSLKYLAGYGNGYIKAENLSYTYLDTGNANTSLTTTTGFLHTANMNSLEDDSPASNRGSGIGADLGFTYEYRPNHNQYSYTDKNGKKQYFKDKNKYLWRIGVSLTDLGSIKYKDTQEKSYSANATYTDAQYDANSNLDAYYPVISQSNTTTAYLPTTLHANVDYSINNRFYLNFNTDFRLKTPTATNITYIANTLSLTPRYEVKWLSIYAPVSYLEYSGLNAGFGFRIGPLFVGSGSVVTALLNETKALDAHLGLKIPIYQGKLKDKDNDGVFDKDDNCLDIAGAIENGGCPWKDTDNDGVLDKEDQCITVAGPVENKGCPWKDTDGDTVLDKDDACPNQTGAVENKGCPYGDKDNDGILDNIDKCPELAGTVANNGCPETKKEEVKEIKEEVLKQLNDYSKSILFDTGKSTIKNESYANLDAIVAVMNNYPISKFEISGHTDNVGKPLNNKKLSEERAAAVMLYLVEKGIASSRLSSQGYGDTKPIDSNVTAQGRNLNRRVEITLKKD